MLKNKTIGFRMLCVIAASLAVTISLLSYVAYVEAEKELVDVGGEMFTKLNHDVIALMDAENEQVKAGKLTLDEAKEIVRTYADGPKLPDGSRDTKKSKMFTDDYMYAWAFTQKTNKGGTVMHPFNLEGKNLWDFALHGRYTVRETYGNLDKIGKPFEEDWQNPGEPKYVFLGYTDYYAPWDWIVGVGGRESVFYEKRLQPVRNKLILWSLLIFVTSLAGGYYLVREIRRSLSAISTDLLEGANEIANAAAQVASSGQSLAQGASEQAASLEETSASSAEINAMVEKNATNSRATADLLVQSQARVDSANQHLVEMVLSMEEITHSSGKISKIIRVIEDIAFQTNILALNAAVEAARAGEAGLGFAIVADEVRSLASRSSQAAKDTSSLIAESVARSSAGKSKVDQVALAIKAMTEDTARIKIMVDEVSLGSEEQARGINQISRAIGRMEQVTQTTAASAEEGAASAEELNAQSESMRDVVGRLQAMVDGGSGGNLGGPAQRASGHYQRPSYV